MASRQQPRQQKQDWYYDAPAASAGGQQTSAPEPTSQAPGLSSDTPAKEDTKILRGSVRESDTSYVKLAKQGGVKNLLGYEHADTQEPAVSQKPRHTSEWFGHQQVSQQSGKKDWKAPDYMVYSDQQQQQPQHNGNNGVKKTDQNFNWAREQRQNNQRKYSHREAPFYTSSSDANKDQDNSGNSRKKSMAKPNNEVNFKKLMGGGYGDDWHTHNTTTSDSNDQSSGDVNE